jgi:hypothetical protein
MRCKSAFLTAFGLLVVATTVWAQGVGGPGQPWRGAGAQPCFGPEGGVMQCAQAPRTVAVRAGRLFDSKTGQMLTNQVIVMNGERITDVGPAATVKIPVGAQVIDLRRRCCRG